MLFRVFLLLMASAFTLFVAGAIVQKFTMLRLVVFFDMLGIDILLAGAALLVAGGVFYLLQSINAHVSRYFSRPEQARRKLWFAQARCRDLELRSRSEQIQLNYQQTIQRSSLLRADDKRHIRLLAKSIGRQLYTARDKIPRLMYKELRHALRANQRRCDSEALLLLQQQIARYQ